MKKSKLWIYIGIGLLLAAAGAVLAITLLGEEGGWSSGGIRPEHGQLQIATEDGLLAQPGQPQLPQTGLDPEDPGSNLEDWIPATTPQAPTESKPSGSTGNSGSTQETTPAPTESPYIQLPYNIPNTHLVLGRLDSYQGTFLEQGTDVSTQNVAMILLLNEGKEAVEYGVLAITLEDGTVLNFEPTCLPAGGKMVVQESDGKAYPGGEIKKCVGETATLKEMPMSTGEVRLTENADSSITVTNLTLRKIPAVRVFYKLYMAEEDGYVGGITYMAKVTDLAAGASITVRPSHYLYGSCKVVMVRTYDKAD